MTTRIERLEKLEATLRKLRDVIAARLATLQGERAALLRKREAIETLMAGDTRFLDLTLGGALRRLKAIAARLAAIDAEAARQRKRAGEAMLKARRAAGMAQRLRTEAEELARRRTLTELGDQLAPASLRQAARR